MHIPDIDFKTIESDRMKRLRQRLISGITALSIFASSMFPAVTVFSEEYTQPAVTDAPESVTDSVQTGTGVPTSDEVFYLPADAGISGEEPERSPLTAQMPFPAKTAMLIYPFPSGTGSTPLRTARRYLFPMWHLPPTR